jgi:hypothetical protein
LARRSVARSRANRTRATLQIALKGGQIGQADYFVKALRGGA